MSPRARPLNTAAQAAFEPLLADRLDEVLRVEQRAYDHPWNHANFVDALQSGYQAQMLVADGYVLGYFVAMKGVDEVHLALWTRGQGLQWLWLEARVSNVRALHVYERYGFRRVGQRKAYYPAGNGQREDAVVMSLPLPELA
jgi:[ribosomal protein S18]-alanine N-acetyltransferase